MTELIEIRLPPAVPVDPTTHRIAGIERLVDEEAGTVTLRPVVVALDGDELAALAEDNRELRRGDRDKAMAEPLNILSRHRNQRDFGLPTTLTEAQAVAWAVYLQGLRDYPETGDWPDKPE